MADRHRDPLELWVGTWTPEEWIERETRRREKDAALGLNAPASPAEGPQEKTE